MKRYAEAMTAAVDHATGLTASMPSQVGPAPWPGAAAEPNHLNAVVWADLVGADQLPPGRAQAMAIPALARQRHLVCGTGAGCPLRAIDGATDTPLPVQPRWMNRTDGLSSPWHRMLWTLDDLVFHGWSVWDAQRGYGEGGTRPLLSAERIAVERWEVDPAGRLLVDGELRAAETLIVIPGPHEGILNFGAPALRRTIDNLEAAANAARNPSAYLELHYTGDDQMTDDQIDAFIARWAKARRGDNGGVSFTNKYLEVKEHGSHEAQLLIEGRNADAVDMSRIVSSPAAMTDATSAGASLTYETTTGRNTQFIDYGVKLYLDAIAARLSMDDVVPRGQRSAFDMSDATSLTPAPTGPQQED